jgi:hypothetical protein
MKILSVDPAVATFAFSIIEVTHNHTETYDTFLKDNIKILYCDMIDLSEGKYVKDMTTIDKLKSLKKYIDIKRHLFVNIDLFIIESQKGYKPNEEFAAVILGVFSQFDIANYIIIDAGKKHEIWFHNAYTKDKFTTLSTKYANNKKHIVEHFRWLIKILNYEYTLPTKFESHISDSIFQALAYYYLCTDIDHSDLISKLRILFANK